MFQWMKKDLGNKVEFMCEKCLKPYHFLLSLKMVGLKGYKRYEVNYGGLWGAVATGKDSIESKQPVSV